MTTYTGSRASPANCASRLSMTAFRQLRLSPMRRRAANILLKGLVRNRTRTLRTAYALRSVDNCYLFDGAILKGLARNSKSLQIFNGVGAHQGDKRLTLGMVAD